MDYYIDTEFIEGFHKPLFGKRRHFIDLISIGIVAEDGREYYAISNEFNHKDASQWVKDTVIKKLPRKYFNGHNVDEAILWKSNKQIAEEVKRFIYKGSECSKRPELWGKDIPINFYAYYADYDWVLFCSLFGTMIDLPKGFPMYCLDLKQMLDESVMNLPLVNSEFSLLHIRERSTFTERLEDIKKFHGYPKQTNEHNAIDDARWNKQLHDFIKKLTSKE